ncbi:hypothetical protein [Haloplanus natans]|uniref:hypothetical protein n=1 Tax=Haloplanus natans TaxID=376171 RepID=UPI000677C25A|nr:hypothetical protein [Haloplanus natans]
MSDELEPIEPDEAVQMYLHERRPEVASSTLQSHEYRLKHLLRWFEQERVDKLNDRSDATCTDTSSGNRNTAT